MYLIFLDTNISFYTRKEAINVKLKGLILFTIVKILGLKNQLSSSAFHLPC